MRTDQNNAPRTTDNAGFPPAPSEVRQQAGGVKQRTTISLRAMRYCARTRKTVWVF